VSIPAPRPAFIVVLEFSGRPAYPIPTTSLAEAEDVAVQAASEFSRLAGASVYRYEGPGEEYRLLQTLELAR
jgi:hypothetical protein